MRVLRNLKLSAGLGLGLLVSPALAQAPVVTQPSLAQSGNASGTVAASNTFQSIWVNMSNPPSSGNSGNRRGCLVINTSTAREWVFFGPLTSAAIAASIPLEPATAVNGLGGYVNCATGGGGVLQDQVSITGTAGSTYVANQQ